MTSREPLGKKPTYRAGGRAGLYPEFWGKFLARLHEDRPSWTQATKPTSKSWITFPSGTSDVLFGTNFRPQGLCSEILFQARSAEANSARLQAFMAHQADVEALVQSELEWQDLAGVKRCRLATYRAESSIEDRSSWPEFMDWFIDSQDRLRNAYAAYGATTPTG
jgi:hypothetical protein